MLAVGEQICNVEYSAHESESPQENLHKHIALLLGRVFVMSSEQVNSLGLLLLSFSYHTSLLLFRPHELGLEDGANEAPEERLELVNVI